jgi:hypothetical protein
LADFLSFDGKRRPQICHYVTDPPAQIFEEEQGSPIILLIKWLNEIKKPAYSLTQKPTYEIMQKEENVQ